MHDHAGHVARLLVGSTTPQGNEPPTGGEGKTDDASNILGSRQQMRLCSGSSIDDQQLIPFCQHTDG